MTLARHAGAWMAGIALAARLEPPTDWLAASTGMCALCLLVTWWWRRLLLRDRRLARERRLVPLAPWLLVLCALAGALRQVTAEPRIDGHHIASWNDRGPVEFKGRIDAEPDVRDKGTQYRVAAERLRSAGGWTEVRGTVLLHTTKHPPRSYGDSVTVRGALVTPPVLDDFDYRAWLAGRGIQSIARRPQIEVTASGGGSAVRRALIGLKMRLRMSLATSIPEPEAGLATGILLGDDNGIPDAVYEAFRMTNTSHVIAISGSNIALLVALLSASFGRLLGRREAVPLILLSLGLYTALVGADAAVVRAAVMGAITVFGVLLGRQSEATTALFAAAWAMTLYRPAYIDDLGFQLSFAATVGLVAFSARWTEWTEAAVARRLGSARAKALTGYFGEAVIVTLAAQVTTWPVIAYQTGEVSVVGLGANFLIVPAQAAVMILSGLAAVGGVLCEPVGRVLGAFAWLPLAYTIRVVEAAARAPLVLVAWSMPLSAVAIYYAALWAVARPESRARLCQVAARLRDRAASGVAIRENAGTRVRQLCAVGATFRTGRFQGGWWPVLALVGSCVLVWVGVTARPDGLLHLYVLDVGQGDALLVVMPNGRRMLVDGGPGPSATLDGLGRRMAPWDRRLDVVVLTHPDGDHVGGLAAVLDRYRVSTIVVPPAGGGGAEARAWEEAAAREGARHVEATAGLRLELDEPGGVYARVLWPDAHDPTALAGEGTNNSSVVLRLQHGSLSMLLTGDIEEPVESRLVSSQAPLAADVLKLGHHGSDTSTTEPFLRAVSPRLALISVGADNGFGHPSPDVLERLGGITVRRTDQVGTIEVISDGRALWVR